jgi:hypothetical protein
LIGSLERVSLSLLDDMAERKESLHLVSASHDQTQREHIEVTTPRERVFFTSQTETQSRSRLDSTLSHGIKLKPTLGHQRKIIHHRRFSICSIHCSICEMRGLASRTLREEGHRRTKLDPDVVVIESHTVNTWLATMYIEFRTRRVNGLTLKRQM